MSIQNVPLITEFDKWVEELPPEHRSEAYKFAESFLCVGGMHGALIGALGTAKMMSAELSSGPEDIPKKSSGNEQDEYVAYLQAKAKESRVQKSKT